MGSPDFEVASRVSESRRDSMMVQGVAVQKYGRTPLAMETRIKPEKRSPAIAKILKNKVPQPFAGSDCAEVWREPDERGTRGFCQKLIIMEAVPSSWFGEKIHLPFSKTKPASTPI